MKPMVLIAFLLLLVSAPVFANDYVIGNGTSTENYVPLYAYNNYSWSKMIFTNSEFAAAGLTTTTTITKIALYVGNSVDNYVTTNQQIYMRTFYDESYGSLATSYPGTAGFTLVYNGSITWTGIGWMEITLDTPYTYNPNWHMEILWENRDGSGTTGYPKFAYTSTSSNYRAVYKYSNSSFPTTAGTRYYNRPNLWFMSAPTDIPPAAIPAVPSDAATQVGVNTNLRWSSGGGSPDSYRIYFGSNNPPSNLVNGTIVSGTEYDIPNYLQYETTYYWRIVPHNSFGYAVDCPVWSFTTATDPTIYVFPWTENFDGTFPGTNWETHSGNLADPVVLGADGSGLWEQDDWLNITGTDKAGKINIWSTVNGWLITPPLNITGDGFTLQFDLALLKYNQTPTGTPPDQTGTDDRFVVLIGDGFSWSTANILQEWNNAGSPYILNNIPVTGETVTIPLPGSARGQRLAFWCGSVTTNADNDVMINNVVVSQSQALSIPIVTISNSGGDIVSLSWTAVSGASNYKIYRCDTPDGTYTQIDTTTETQYPVIPTGSKYFYKVTASTE